MFQIQYEHEQGGVLYCGTFSGGTMPAKAAWSCGGGEPKDAPIDEDTFSLLWNGISEFQIFPKSLVKKPPKEIDRAANHLVTVTFEEGKGSKKWTYIVPVAEANDEEFARWLAALNRPAGAG